MRKLAAIAIASVTLLSQAEVVINEIMADNDGKFPNAAGEAMDWIELYNPGEMPADLTGWRITDTVEDPWSKWKEIPAGAIVPAQGYLLLWGHNKDFPTPEDAKGFCGITNGEVHVKLGLSSGGETIALAASEADYDAKAFVDRVTFGAQFADVSYGRDPNDTAKWLFFANATPGAANGTDGLEKYLPDEEQGGEEPGPGGDEDVDGPREGEFAVMLDVSRPVADKAMKATVTGERTGNVTFAWFVREPTGAYGDAVCEGREYTPTAADYEHWVRVVATDEGGASVNAEFYFSKLPIVYINTDDGKPVTVKTEYKGATIRIQGNDLYDQQYDGKSEIKGRGNSTWQYDKKPYKLKLSKKTDLFGFGKNKHWVLLANYLDQSLMRNKTAYDLSGMLGLVHMSSEWTDVVINGEYVGNYLLCEHIRVGSDRIDVFDWEGESEDRGGVAEDLSWVDPAKDDISGGYVFEMDDYYDEPSKFQTAGGMKVMVNAPEYLCTSAAMMDFVKGYWNRFEAAYTSADGYDPTGTHYSQLVDIDSMVAYWLVQEIFGNVDAQNHSRYAYKDVGAPMYLGPAWDFDISSGGLPPSSHGLGWKLAQQDSFYREWLDDPMFCLLAWEAYWTARGLLDEYFRDGGVADANAAYLAESGAADTERWGANLSAVVIGKASYRWNEALGFEGDFSRFKNYMQERLAWMDKQFASVNRLMLAVRASKSATPYTKDDVTLSISFGNGKDAEKTGAATDFVLNRGEKAPQVRVAVSNGAIVKLHAYVNGLKYGIYDVADDVCEFTVSADKMVAEPGHRDMVSLIAKDAEGKTIARNYLTILNPPIPPVTVTEIMADNGGSLLTADGKAEDWIELYNPGATDADISGWRLCDSTTKKWSKWEELPKGTIVPAGGYLIVWADDFTGWTNGEVHVNLGFSSKGEEVALAIAEGVIVSSFAFGPQQADISFGRDPSDSEKLVYFKTPTPGAANGDEGREALVFTIDFDSNGGTPVASVTNDYDAAISAPEAPARTGYTFGGWYESGAADPFVFSRMPARDVSLTAHWTPNEYTVDFNPGQGGEGTMSDQPMVYDEAEALYSNVFCRTGYTFLGWTDDERELAEVMYYDGVVVSNLTDEADGEYDLYAVWAANEYTVTFDANGGTGTMEEQMFLYDEQQSLASNTFVKANYVFAGWAVAEGHGSTVYADGEVVSNLTAEADGVVTLCAQWKLDGWETISGARMAVETGLIGYKARGLPKGLTYSKTTGEITGTATKSGEFVVTFTKNGAETRQRVIVVRAEEVSIGCEGLSAGSFSAGVGMAGGIDIQTDNEGGTKSVSVTKLPAGMKYDSKSGKITGVPSTAGDYVVVLTMTTKYGTKETVNIPVSVTAMPETAVGTFNGFVSVGNDTHGSITLTTTAAGKLTAKVVTAAGSVSFSGKSWDSVEQGVYRATLTTKKGEKLELALDSTAAWDANQLAGDFMASTGNTYSVSAQRNAFGKAWYFTATGDETNGWAFAFTKDAKSAALTVTLKADGSTAIAGKLPNGKDGKNKDVTIKVSASGFANVGGLHEGAVLADFTPVLTVGGKKKVLAIKANLWFDRKNDHDSGVGGAKFVE